MTATVGAVLFAGGLVAVAILVAARWLVDVLRESAAQAARVGPLVRAEWGEMMGNVARARSYVGQLQRRPLEVSPPADERERLRRAYGDVPPAVEWVSGTDPADLRRRLDLVLRSMAILVPDDDR